jgi:hypothetical protein
MVARRTIGFDAAVIFGGMDTVSSGSRIATFGINLGEKITVLRFVASNVTTPLRPTSVPVPAVVGTAIIGGTTPVILAPPPIASSY